MEQTPKQRRLADLHARTNAQRKWMRENPTHPDVIAIKKDRVEKQRMLMLDPERRAVRNARERELRALNPEPRRASFKKWRAKNKRIRTPEQRARENELARANRAANPEKERQRLREWNKKNRHRLNGYHSKWLAKNPGYTTKYNADNKETIAAARRKNENERYANDPAFKMLKNIRCRLAKELRKATTNPEMKVGKTATTVSLLGCSIANFVIYVESLWEPGMSWKNYGCGPNDWSIDHELPFAIFDLTKPEHQKRACHFSNLKPMWHIENMRKGDKTNFHPNHQTEKLSSRTSVIEQG